VTWQRYTALLVIAFLTGASGAIVIANFIAVRVFRRDLT
jgi:hypothetical protein